MNIGHLSNITDKAIAKRCTEFVSPNTVFVVARTRETKMIPQNLVKSGAVN